ncbi:MAG TPA: T9SS type A sorting domain-containing protein, partial [Bacteroidetes bacterium]|nr:T9SS type A sorting domain-containing protein [Bacteroidota bacterium]
VAAADDGGPHTMILPGETWSPDFTVLDEATTFWYHPHLHSKTAEQVYKGLAGMIIVRDSAEAMLDLPRTYGVDDFPLIIQDKSFDTSNQFIFAALSDTIMINGTLSPFLEVPAQMVRFRLLNGSNQRVYNIGIPPALPAWQIGTDGGLLAQPLPISRIRIAPGERAEIVINFGQLPVSSNVLMPIKNSELGQGVSGGPMGPMGGPGNLLDGADFDFMKFRVTPATTNPVLTISQNLNSINPWDELSADLTRVKVFDTIAPNSFPYLINSTGFDLNTINDTVFLGNTEIWELYNETTVAHPFHIHDIQFYILELNGNVPPPHLRGKKDVILSLPGDTIRFICKFEDFTDNTIPYMYHCHNLFHEDAGMMGQFIVIDNPNAATDALEEDLSGRFRVFPNPTEGIFQIIDKEKLFRGIQSIEIHSLAGKLLMRLPVQAGIQVQQVDLAKLASGMYLLDLMGKTGARSTLRIMKE